MTAPVEEPPNRPPRRSAPPSTATASSRSVRGVRGDLADIRRTRWAWQGWAPLGSFLLVAGEPGIGKGVITATCSPSGRAARRPATSRASRCRCCGSGSRTPGPRSCCRGWSPPAPTPTGCSTCGSHPPGALPRPGPRPGGARRARRRARHPGRRVRGAGRPPRPAPTTTRTPRSAAALAPVVELARARQLLVIGTTHLNKTTTGGYRHRVAGSRRLPGRRPRRLARPPPPRRPRAAGARVSGRATSGGCPTRSCSRSRASRSRTRTSDEVADVGRVAHDPEPYFDRSLTVDEVLAGPKPDHGSKEDEVVEFLEEFLRDGPRRAVGRVRGGRRARLSEKMLRKHREAAGVDLYQEARAWWWRLKEGP